jgi:hypothetical protein
MGLAVFAQTALTTAQQLCFGYSLPIAVSFVRLWNEADIRAMYRSPTPRPRAPPWLLRRRPAALRIG